MLDKWLGFLGNSLLSGAAVCLVVAAALLWSIPGLKALPTPEEATGPIAEGWPLEPDRSQDCLSCHWDATAGLLALRSTGAVAREADNLSESWAANSQVASGQTIFATPTPLPIHKGAIPVGLSIPSVDIEGKVRPARASALEGGSEWEIPLEDIAWFMGTALPGARGNAVMSGHVATRSGGGVFRNLYRVMKGTTVEIRTTEGSVIYLVTNIRVVLPTEISVLTDTKEPTLTLITCTGDFDETTRTYSHRLVVSATKV